VALAEELEVEREHQGRALRGAGALDELVHEDLVLHDVELEPEGLFGDVLADVLDGADGHGGEREGDAEPRGGAGGEDLAVGVLHAEGADGREGRGHGHALAQHGALEGAVDMSTATRWRKRSFS
jgi:hypothetical protein